MALVAGFGAADRQARARGQRTAHVLLASRVERDWHIPLFTRTMALILVAELVAVFAYVALLAGAPL
jgi:hypothetical protein